MNDTPITLSRAELKSLMQEAVAETFTKMGMDVGDPLEMQRDFQHLREWRVAVGAMRTKGTLTVLTILITGAAAALWVGFRAAVGAS